MKKLSLVASTIMMFSFSASSQQSTPAYDCTASETKVYIEQVTHGLFAPSSIPTPEEFTKAHTEAKEQAGDSSCSTIFTDGRLEADWKELVDNIRDFDLTISIGDPSLGALLKKAKDQVTKQLTEALEELGGDICGMMQTDALKKMLLDTVNDKYGLNARKLRIEDFANSITDEQMQNAPDNIQMLLSEREFFREVDSVTTGEIRKQRKSLWDNF
jgi:hypothetical protein